MFGEAKEIGIYITVKMNKDKIYKKRHDLRGAEHVGVY